MIRCAVFASGGGSNFQALIDRKNAGVLHVELSLLICNSSKAGAMERASRNSIRSVHLAPSHFPDEASYSAHLVTLLDQAGIELIILAGYMKKLPAAVVRRFTNRIVNIHPALLPAFGGTGMYGHHVHEAVLAYGAKISGVTVHFVSEEYDTGPVILQDTVAVLDGDTPDTLAARVLEKEHECYWKAIEAIAANRITVEGRRVYGTV